MLAERVQGLGAGFPQSSLRQDVVLFIRYLLEMHPDLVLEVQSKRGASPLLSPPSYVTLLPSGGQGHGWHLQLAQLQCDHLKGR